MTNITVEEYKDAINPHVGWLLGQIENSKDGYILMKISDVAKVMGKVFCEKSEVSIYVTLRHTFQRCDGI